MAKASNLIDYSNQVCYKKEQAFDLTHNFNLKIMVGYGDFVSPGWFQDNDIDITIDDDDLWLSKNLRDEH